MKRSCQNRPFVTGQGCMRRRGSVLVLVMAILGILFVTGVALLATMKFEADIQQSTRNMDRNQVSVDLIGSTIDASLRRSVTMVTEELLAGNLSDLQIADAAFLPGATILEGDPEDRTSQVKRERYDVFSPSFADLPVVTGALSQIDPYWEPSDDNSDRHVYASICFPQVMRTGMFSQFDEPLWDSTEEQFSFERLRDVDARYRDSGNADGAAVDADGDGIVDSRQFDVAWLGLPGPQQAAISQLVNAPDKQDNGVYLSLRTVSHGGMVNLNHAHPWLIQKLLDPFGEFSERMIDPWAPREREYKRYVPDLEEPSLRYRGGLIPPRNLPVTVVQGNPLGEDGARWPGGGHFGMVLFGWQQDDPSRDRETVMDGHRYWPYSQDEHEQWSARTDPASAIYDVRHLVTVSSHDDNLARPTRIHRRPHNNGTPLDETDDPEDLVDAIDVMNSANDLFLAQWIELDDPALQAQFPFSPYFLYPAYPYVLDPAAVNPDFEEELYPPYDVLTLMDNAKLEDGDVRTGHLRLSLPYLDSVLRGVLVTENDEVRLPIESPAVVAAREALTETLIHDTFMLMLHNAVYGSAWADEGVDTTTCPGDGVFEEWPADVQEQTGTLGFCKDRTGRNKALRERERTAAALTANMLDYVDADSIPTRVAVRRADFSDYTTLGQPRSRVNADPDPWAEDVEYVYGLEMQPFISEVAAYFDVSGEETTGMYAIELFNPFDEDLDLTGFSVRIYGGGALKGIFDLSGTTIAASGFHVFTSSGDGPVGELDNVTVAENWGLEAGDTVYVVFSIGYPGDVDLNGSPVITSIVVDEFQLRRADSHPLQMCIIPTEAGVKTGSMQRPGVSPVSGQNTSPWAALIPVQEEREGHTLGGPNLPESNPNIVRVPLGFANTGVFRSAFPTTGSMLVLPRYANRSLTDLENPLVPDEGLAFTTKLFEEQQSIDNGRMPLFDPGFLHHRNPLLSEEGVPGGVCDLPWGQLVFDYFTALPIENGGPYWDLTAETVDQDAQPRVDLNGLRVHGRIDINAAPWPVMAGLPLVPKKSMELVPSAYVDPMWEALEEVIPDLKDLPEEQCVPIGFNMAQGIVAYRDMRRIVDAESGGETGDYSVEVGGRPWGPLGGKTHAPDFRRGTGFLTVGELANVRHEAATTFDDGNPYTVTSRTWSKFRTDAGVVGRPAVRDQYLQAAALLMALGDWVTVRSHVFTVYGTLRGDEEDDPAAVDARAIRFQETIDRLPTLMGMPSPTRIGDRVIEKYLDTDGR